MKIVSIRFEWLQGFFKVIDNNKMYDYRALLEFSQSIKDAWNFDGLLIDPYNSLIKATELIKNVGGHEYDYQATTEMRIFCKKTGVTIWLNTHANTNALKTKHPIGYYYADILYHRASDIVKITIRLILRLQRYIKHLNDVGTSSC